MDSTEAKQESEILYTPEPGELQLTARAVIVGCFIGAIVTAMNLYLGLKIGWSIGGSLLAAILGFAFFAVLAPATRFTVLECNITQTTGSGAGTMASAAGLLAPIPAMKMLGYDIPIWGLYLWAAAVAYLGVQFAVPLRRQYVVFEKLRFPTGTATANTIMAMYATAGEAVAKARVLLLAGAFAFVYMIITKWVPAMEAPPLHVWIGGGTLATMAAYSFSLAISPMLFGAGFLIGPRIGTSLLLGAIAGWGVLGYVSQDYGWAANVSPGRLFDPETGDAWVRGWILWPGVAIMVGDALMSLALSWRTFVSAFKGTKAAAAAARHGSVPADEVPTKWWTSGLVLASIATTIVAYFAFGVPWYLTLIAIALSSILANVAVRSTGETDINPVGGMGKVTQLAFGGLSASQSVNLMGAAVTGAGASQAGDMMQDLKTGHLLGASPKKQYKAQLVGIAAGAISAVSFYLLFDKAYDIGAEGSEMGAPAAVAWKAVAEVMSKGLDALPPMAEWAVFFGLAFGALIPIIRKVAPKTAKYTPSGLAFGIAFIVQAYYAIPMFVGSMCLLIWKKTNPEQCKRFVFALASGLIVGEGLAGVAKAIMSIAGL